MIPFPTFDEGVFVPRLWQWPVPGSDEPPHRDNPLDYLTDIADILAAVADDMDRGFLFAPGGIRDQPARLMLGVRMLRSARNHARNLASTPTDLPMGVTGG